MEKMAEAGADIIVTIDCGTSDLVAAERAIALSVDLIVTDHHEPKEELPKAVAVINPRIGIKKSCSTTAPGIPSQS